MAGEHGKAARGVAVGDRNPRVGRSRDGARHARNDFEWQPGPGQRLSLLAAPAEDEWVPTLEPHHGPAEPCLRHQDLVDLLLRHRMAIGLFPHVDPLCMRRLGQKRPRDQPVVHDHTGPAQTCQPPDGDQARIARPRANQVNRARGQPCRLLGRALPGGR